MKIVSWNVNLFNVCLLYFIQWLVDVQLDVVVLQEIKLEDVKFLVDVFVVVGYCVVYVGQKIYNGVVLLVWVDIQLVFVDVVIDIFGLDDLQWCIFVVIIGELCVVDLYVVNGKVVGDEKYVYKLNWMVCVCEFFVVELECYLNFVVLGDFNICLDDCDVYDLVVWGEDIFCLLFECVVFKVIIEFGLYDSFCLFEIDVGYFSWWDY